MYQHPESDSISFILHKSSGPNISCMPLKDIATEQTKATEKTEVAKDHILDYLATHPDATIR
jgi:hypothetical protein